MIYRDMKVYIGTMLYNSDNKIEEVGAYIDFNEEKINSILELIVKHRYNYIEVIRELKEDNEIELEDMKNLDVRGVGGYIIFTDIYGAKSTVILAYGTEEEAGLCRIQGKNQLFTYNTFRIFDIDEDIDNVINEDTEQIMKLYIDKLKSEEIYINGEERVEPFDIEYINRIVSIEGVVHDTSYISTNQVIELLFEEFKSSRFNKLSNFMHKVIMNGYTVEDIIYIKAMVDSKTCCLDCIYND